MRKVRKKDTQVSGLDQSAYFEQFNTETDYADIYAHDFFQGKDPGSI